MSDSPLQYMSDSPLQNMSDSPLQNMSESPLQNMSDSPFQNMSDRTISAGGGGGGCSNKMPKMGIERPALWDKTRMLYSYPGNVGRP